MKRFKLSKNCTDEAFNASSLRRYQVSTLYKFMKKSQLNSAGLSDTHVKGKMTKFFAFATEIYYLLNHHFIASNR